MLSQLGPAIIGVVFGNYSRGEYRSNRGHRGTAMEGTGLRTHYR